MTRLMLALVFLIGSSPVAAQIPSSSLQPLPRSGNKAGIDGAVELKRLAACAARRDRAHAVSLLKTQPDSDAESRVARTIDKTMENCMTDYRPGMLIGWIELRGATAEALYLTRFATDLDFKALDHSSEPMPSTWMQGGLSDHQTFLVISHAFAQCVVAKDPAETAALIRTVPRSSEEAAALARIRPDFGPCLMKGQTFHFDAAITRAFLTEALWRGVSAWAPTYG